MKALKELHEQQAIAGKVSGRIHGQSSPREDDLPWPRSGKQVVYHAVQEPKGAASQEDLAEMDKEIERLRESVAAAKAREKLLKASLATVNATLSSEDLRASIIALELEQTEILARLGPLRRGSVTPVAPEDKEQAEKLWRQWSRKSASRKRFCMEMWSYCTEELPEGQTKEELWVCLTDTS